MYYAKNVFGLIVVTVVFLATSISSIGAEKFTCTGGYFKDSIKTEKEGANGECVLYVRHETGIDKKGCSGEAYTCYDDAQTADYAVGGVPRESSIIVFNKVPGTRLEHGHVGIIVRIDGNNLTIRDSNWTAYHTVDEHIINVKNYNILGYIYCDGENGEGSHDVTVPTQGNYAWTKGSGESCQDGTNHYLLDRFGLAIPIPQANACQEVSQMCSNSPLRRKSKRSAKLSSNPFTDDFRSSVWKVVSNSAHDLFGADPAKACEDHVVYRTIRFKYSGEAQIVSDTKSDIKVFHPQSATLTPPVVKPDPLPDLQIQKMEVFDEDYLLTEERSYMEVGKTYQIHVWPVSEKEDCEAGIKEGKDTVETDTFWKIKDSSDGWRFLGRSYTRCVHMVEDDSKREVLSFTVPEEATGKKIYFKSKVDSTGEVTETDEHNNWSDDEWYFADFGVHYPDITLTDFSLTLGRTSLSLGDRFGVRTVAANQGNAPAVENVRLIYSLWPPNANDWADQTDDKVIRDQMCAGCSKEELTQDEPFEANQLGTWGAKVCASFQPRELNFNNNCWWFSFEVTEKEETSLPDYTVLNAALTGNRTSLSLGDHFGIWMTVANIGNAPAPKDSIGGYYVMYPNTENWVYLTNDTTNKDQLCVGCSHLEYTHNDPFVADRVGIWQALACSSYKYEEKELDYANNCKEIRFEVTAGPVKLPDYTILNAALTEHKTFLKLGDHFGIRGVVSNIGNADSKEDTRLGYYLMRPGAGVWQYQTDDKITAGQMCASCSKEELTQDDPFEANQIGTWGTLVCASYKYDAKELHYDNNCKEFFFNVKPDFDFEWSFAGTISGKTCVNFWEGADPYTWGDNYLCSKDNLGIQWSPAGPINNMRCMQINETASPPEYTWADNYLCVPNDSPIFFSWSSAGPINGLECVKINEPAEPPNHTWEDNWLCY